MSARRGKQENDRRLSWPWSAPRGGAQPSTPVFEHAEGGPCPPSEHQQRSDGYRFFAVRLFAGLRAAVFLAADFLAAVFLRVVFLRVVFLAAGLRAAVFLRVVFLRAGLRAAVFFFAAGLRRVVFLRVVFFAAGLRAAVFRLRVVLRAAVFFAAGLRAAVLRFAVDLFFAGDIGHPLPSVSGRHTLQASPFAFTHPTPHPVPLVAAKGIVEALDANRTIGADPLGLSR